jgi:acetyltransferase-like isoleucine patch superfamily enzyme
MQSEKEKMQRGKTYNMLDSELQHDREQCRKNLNTFNTSVVSTAERERQLRSIIEPEGALQQQQQASLHGPSDTSRLSKNVIVEAPFRCDYGYNVNLAPKVWIEAGCTITDAAEVRICEGAHIGPDVKILGRVEPWNPQFWWRADPTGRPTVRIAKGIQIIIGRNVFVGGGAVIAPEWDPKWDPSRDSEDARPPRLEIGNNARILPGAVVRRVSALTEE